MVERRTFNPVVEGSIPSSGATASLAQLVEQSAVNR